MPPENLKYCSKHTGNQGSNQHESYKTAKRGPRKKKKCAEAAKKKGIKHCAISMLKFSKFGLTLAHL